MSAQGDRAMAAAQAGCGPVLGLVMLDTHFPRPPGDAGHPATFDAPVLRETVPGAAARDVISGHADIDAFIAAARRLERRGATLIATSCGFLAPRQGALARACGVPVVASVLNAPLPARTAILTISAADLGPHVLAACGLDPDTPVLAPPRNGAFLATILGDRRRMGLGACCRELCDAARPAARTGADLLVLECTNMHPHAAAIAHASGLPTLSLTDVLSERLARQADGFRAQARIAS